MNAEPRLDKCLTFINCQLRPTGAMKRPPLTIHRWRAVTISRQTGSGGHAVAEELAECLHDLEGADSHPWTVFDRNLVEKVLEDHHLPARMAKFMPEDRVSQIEDVLENLCGLHPPFESLVEKVAETVRRLAELGNVILLGRGANVVTGNLDYVFHVRLVGSIENRVEFLQESRHIARAAALNFIRTEDRGRKRYLKKYFHKDINDPLLYHLVINTDRIEHKIAARMIAATMLSSVPGFALQAPGARAVRAA
jgi:cytidylate kinase